MTFSEFLEFPSNSILKRHILKYIKLFYFNFIPLFVFIRKDYEETIHLYAQILPRPFADDLFYCPFYSGNAVFVEIY